MNYTDFNAFALATPNAGELAQISGLLKPCLIFPAFLTTTMLFIALRG